MNLMCWFPLKSMSMCTIATLIRLEYDAPIEDDEVKSVTTSEVWSNLTTRKI